MMRLLGFDMAGRGEPLLWRGAAMGFGAALFECAPIAALALLLPSALAGDGAAWPWALFAVLLAASVVAWALKASAMLDSFVATYGLIADMRLRLADRLGRMPLGRIHRRRGAALADLFTDRFALYQDIVTHVWWQFATAAGTPLIAWAILAALDWRLGLTLAAFAPIAAAAVPWSFRRLDRATDAVMPARDDLAARIVEIADGAKDLRLADPARSRCARALEATELLERRSIETEIAPAPAILAFGLIWSLAAASVALVGALLWSGGHLGGPVLVAALLVAGRAASAASELGVFLVECRMAFKTLASIRALAEEPEQPQATTPAEPSGYRIEIDDVGFSHADKPTLEGISLTVPEGALVALVGPSGAGKSTLAGLVARLWDVGSGAVRIGGVDVRDMSAETLNRTVSMALQDVELFELSVADNIRLGKPDATLAEVEAAARAARIDARIRELPDGYATTVEADGRQFSGGERQRLAIARAMLKAAPILIFDEATASLDLDNEHLVQRAIEALAKDKTVIVVAHRLWTIENADAIVTLDRGRMAETGTHAELVARGGRYKALLDRQSGAAGWRS